MKDYSLFDKELFVDKSFPVKILNGSILSKGLYFNRHWHEQLEIIYFKSGSGTIKCNSESVNVSNGDILVINSNDIYSGICVQPPLVYYCIIIDTQLFKGNDDASCDQKYITPIFQNLIQFHNKIPENSGIKNCIQGIIDEYDKKEIGYELVIKSFVYKLTAVLLRNHIEKVLQQKEYEIRVKNLEKLNKVLNFIENNFIKEITIDQLADMCYVSRYYFCRLFKKFTGKTVSEYVNGIRINKAEQLLKHTDMYIHEIAAATGFNDTNYFSRTYRKFKKISPAIYRKDCT